MKNELGIEMTDKEVIKECLNDLGNALCFAFELQTPEGKAFAFMLDSVVKYGQVVMRGDCPIDATADYNAYEQKVYLRDKRNITVIK